MVTEDLDMQSVRCRTDCICFYRYDFTVRLETLSNQLLQLKSKTIPISEACQMTDCTFINRRACTEP